VLTQEGQAAAEIAPSLGNNCFLFQVDRPVLEPVDFEEFLKRPASFGIPILFPFPNRIRDGVFMFRGRRYEVNPTRHGFVRDKAWKVLATGASDEEGAWIKSWLDATWYHNEVLGQFPFPFVVEVVYRLKDGRLTMETLVRNTGNQDMPCGFGVHPYFHCTEIGTIEVPAQKRWELKDSLPTGRLLDVDGGYDLTRSRDLQDLVLDDIYTDLKPEEDRLVRCRLTDGRAGMQTVIEFDAKQFPHLVVYTPPEPRRAICIEPYTCPTDAFNLEDRGVESNVIVLKPGGSFELTLAISSRRI
jgi:aldose 1-epimerase